MNDRCGEVRRWRLDCRSFRLQLLSILDAHSLCEWCLGSHLSISNDCAMNPRWSVQPLPRAAKKQGGGKRSDDRKRLAHMQCRKHVNQANEGAAAPQAHTQPQSSTTVSQEVCARRLPESKAGPLPVHRSIFGWFPKTVSLWECEVFDDFHLTLCCLFSVCLHFILSQCASDFSTLLTDALTHSRWLKSQRLTKHVNTHLTIHPQQTISHGCGAALFHGIDR